MKTLPRSTTCCLSALGVAATIVAAPSWSWATPPASQPTSAPTSSINSTISELRKTQRALRERLEKLEQAAQDRELADLKQDAKNEAASAGAGVAGQVAAAKNIKQRTFTSGERSLQALNPEISIMADALGLGIFNKRGYTSEADRSGFVFRVLELHVQAVLDPFSMAKFAIEFTPEGVEVGEAYMTWTSLLPGLSLTAGRFRQQLGIVNRWHEHGLDQQDRPLAAQELLGPEGLVQTGVAIEWLMPRLWAHANQLLLQITNSENEQLFAGEFFSIPSVLLRLQSYYNLSEATYFELGLTGVLGWNNARGQADDAGQLVNESARATWVFGADWTLQWEPLAQAKYRNILLRGELYGVHKDLGAGRSIMAVGLYQQIEAKVSRRFTVGARFDWTQPFAENNGGQHILGVEPYVTFWQSEYVRLRLHYAFTYRDVQVTDAPRQDHRVLLQLTFAVGPHKHDRY